MPRFMPEAAISAAMNFLVPVAMADDAANTTAFNNHCRTCHSTREGDNGLGPSMHGIFGAEAGTVPGFRGYSGGLTGFKWDEAMLDRFISKPVAVSASTDMTFPPVADAVERKKIIKYLMILRNK